MSVPILPVTSLQRPMFLLNSRLGLLSAALSAFNRKTYNLLGLPFSRSYGDNLPSSLGWFNSYALGYLPMFTCVGFGTVAITRSFSAAWSTTLRLPDGKLAFAPQPKPTRLDRDNRHPAVASLLRHFHCYSGTGIFTCFPSATPFGFTLGSG